jgi:hypothetical protein
MLFRPLPATFILAKFKNAVGIKNIRKSVFAPSMPQEREE